MIRGGILNKQIAARLSARASYISLYYLPQKRLSHSRTKLGFPTNLKQHLDNYIFPKVCRSSLTMGETRQISYLTQAQAKAIDEELMGPVGGFSVDQLMELAGLSVAQAVAAEYPVDAGFSRVLVLAGPGNNGGDGLVAARHLTHFGYSVQVCYPRPTDRPLYHGLVTQLHCLEVPVLGWALPGDSSPVQLSPERTFDGVADVVIDALFGFGFSGEPRAPFDEIIKLLAPESRPPPVVAVDVPSGWQVDDGASTTVAGRRMRPDMLVSLTAPKLCAKAFEGRHHYLGGRFVPPTIRQKYSLVLPPYPNPFAQCVKITDDRPAGVEEDRRSTSAPVESFSSEDSRKSEATAAATAAAGSLAGEFTAMKVDQMRISYERGGLDEAELRGREPMGIWADWFAEAVNSKLCTEPNAISLASSEDGNPSVRVVLLKGFDERGFTIFTNYDSRKGREILLLRRAAFVAFWGPLQRQVRVEGDVGELPGAESDAYFQSRPHDSRIGAWASQQSQPVLGRVELEERFRELSAQFPDRQPVPRPPNWGGLLIVPRRIEFWQGRPGRLHDRILFERNVAHIEAPWTMTRLQP